MSERRRRIRRAASTLAGALRTLVSTLVEPLRSDPEMELRLSIPEAQTTTVDGDVGWASRPPAWVRCPRCDDEIYHRVREPIDCPGCRAEFPAEDFPRLDLLAMRCPVCGNRMEFGYRHPETVDVPEYATCNRCQYHWELEHF
ncbi:MAG: hypothetical protein ABEJ73_04045 [Haloplanus sp.]